MAAEMQREKCARGKGTPCNADGEVESLQWAHKYEHPGLSTAAARWWVRTSSHPWGGSGNRRLLPWGVPDPPGGETRECPLILCGLKHGMR